VKRIEGHVQEAREQRLLKMSREMVTGAGKAFGRRNL